MTTPKNTLHDLAAKMVDFMKSYDFYAYQDNLEIGQTDEDVIARIVADLSSGPCFVKQDLLHFSQMLEDDLTDEQRRMAQEIIRGLNSILEEE